MKRILLINPNTTSSITDRMVQYLESVIAEPVEFVGVTGRFGAHYISSRAAAAIAGHAALDAMAEHVGDCGAVYLACFGDPGLLALKELSPVPVVGMAEAACIDAAKDNRRFSIVTGGSAWEAMLTEFVQTIGLSEQLASIRAVTMTGDQIAADPDGAVTPLAQASRACAEIDGADVVILGGAALAGLAVRLQPFVPIPVICSVEAGARAALNAISAPRSEINPPHRTPSVGLSPLLATRLAGPT